MKSLTTRIVTQVEAFKALQEPWSGLSKLSKKGTVFNSWEWLFTWWQIYHDDGKRSLFILLCEDDQGEILGIAPFQLVNNPKQYFPCSRQILFLGTGETDGALVFGEYVDLIIHPDFEQAGLNAFSECLLQRKKQWNGLKFQQLLADSLLSRLFDKHKHGIQQTITAYGFRTLISLPESYKDYLMSLKKKKRNNITRFFSRLQAEQSFTIETIQQQSEVKNAVQMLADLNLNRRGSMGQDSVFESERFVQFHQQLLLRIVPLNKVEFLVLRIKDEPVAALYSFADKGYLHAYQSGMDNEMAQRYSLMTTIITQQIKHLIENQPEIKYFNFMFSEHEETYKRHYASATEQMYDISYDKKGMRFTLYRWLHGPIKSLVKSLLDK